MKLFLTKFIDFVRVDGKIFVRVSVNSHFASDRAVIKKAKIAPRGKLFYNNCGKGLHDHSQNAS